MQRPDPVEFRRALSCFTTGVTVITAANAKGEVVGMTANSFTSVSLAPPTVLVSVMQGQTLQAIRASSRFGVNVLGAGCEGISNHFAGKPSTNWTPEFKEKNGFFALDGALAHFGCRVVQEVDVADHVLLIAEVDLCTADDNEPLVFYASRYRSLAA